MGMVLQRCRKRWLWVGFLGGEPLLHPEFDLLLRLIQASADDAGVKLRLVLSTNGTIFDRHLAGLLAEYRVHTSVSLDGPEKVQDMQRPYASGAGSYSIVLQNTKRFIDVCGPELISVRVTLTPFNVSHRRVIAAKVRKALGHHVSFDFEPVTVEGSHAFSWSKPALEEYRRTEREAFEDSMSEMEPALRADPTRIHAALLENRLYKRVRLATLCEFGVNQVAVTADGDVYPCIGVVGCHSLRMGNVSEGGLQMSGTVRDLFINRIVTRMPHCRQCWAKYLCGGGCAAAIKRYCGSFLTRSEEMCVFRKSRAESSIFRFINLLDLYASRLGAGGTFN
jgi:uncharacterized protein